MNVRNAIVLVIGFFALLGCEEAPQKTAIRFDRQSEYERIFVVDKGDWRYLRFGTPDGDNQSIRLLSNPDAVPGRYIRIATLGVVLTEKLDRALMLGLGGGTYTTFLRRHFPDLAIDVVEIDPVVVEAAKRFFGVEEDARLRIHIQDGAKFIRETEAVYDLVFLDAYSGEGLPEQLASPAFFDAVGKKTAEGGVVILNLFRLNGRERSLLAAFQESFPGIACIRTADDLNLVVFGKTAGVPVRTEVVAAARRFTEASALSFDLDRIAGKLNITCTGPGWVEPP